ncbi:MAG: sigma-54 dependent transcriptional regulator [Bacteroidales bacterium]
MERTKMLIIDDEENLRKILSRLLELEGFQVLQAQTSAKGMELFRSNPDILVVVTDVRLPDDSGIQVLKKVKSLQPEVEVVVITAFGKIQDGVECMKNGAFDYLTKDDQNDQMVVTIQRAAEKAAMVNRINELESRLTVKYRFENISGTSCKIKDALEMAKKVAQTDTSVLLEGETGTGKELFAQAIHYGGARRKKSFVAVNCSAMPRDLLESELFGYSKGAFTGALGDKTGLFEASHGGTLFLDEIGEMDMLLQAKLLRAIETQTFLRIGDTRETQVNVRIIAATNKNLRTEVEEGNFREDLFHRLSVFTIRIPPLRDRQEDIEILAQEFLKMFATNFGKSIRSISPEVLATLREYPWKGNIRELRNTIERAVILANDNLITVDLLPMEIRFNEQEAFSHSLAEQERLHILKILHLTNNNKPEAAKMLGIGLATLYRKLEEYHTHDAS